MNITKNFSDKLDEQSKTELLEYAIAKGKNEAAAYMVMQNFKPDSTDWTLALSSPAQIAKHYGGKIEEAYKAASSTNKKARHR